MVVVKSKLAGLVRWSNSYVRTISTGHDLKKPPWRVLFFGTDEFSLYSLKELNKQYRIGKLISHLEVVTKIKNRPNVVEKYASDHKLPVHCWPLNSGKHSFHVGLVVSFGYLIPEDIITSFPFGLLNVHASLLPRWRGAAPIIYALAKGDQETGVSVMKIQPKVFDVGEILLQTKVPIKSDMRMPELYEELGIVGSKTLTEVLTNLSENIQNAKPQSTKGVTYAPKVDSSFSRICWHEMNSTQIINLDRAVTSLFYLNTTWHGLSVKLIDVEECDSCISEDGHSLKPGLIKYDKKTQTVKVLCVNDTWVSIKKIGVQGKKVMRAVDFNNGYIKKESETTRYFS